jgi:hypothetical protein
VGGWVRERERERKKERKKEREGGRVRTGQVTTYLKPVQKPQFIKLSRKK